MMAQEHLCQSERLSIDLISTQDTAFIVELVNSPGWLKYIGDRKVYSEEDAKGFIENRLWAHQEKHGYGTWKVSLKEDMKAIGVCGFVKRDYLDDADIGFALLPEYQGSGYMSEAAMACLEFGKEQLGFRKVMAISNCDNLASHRLLGKIGFVNEGKILPPDEHEEIFLFSREF